MATQKGQFRLNAEMVTRTINDTFDQFTRWGGDVEVEYVTETRLRIKFTDGTILGIAVSVVKDPTVEG